MRDSNLDSNCPRDTMIVPDTTVPFVTSYDGVMTAVRSKGGTFPLRVLSVALGPYLVSQGQHPLTGLPVFQRLPGGDKACLVEAARALAAISPASAEPVALNVVGRCIAVDGVGRIVPVGRSSLVAYASAAGLVLLPARYRNPANEGVMFIIPNDPRLPA